MISRNDRRIETIQQHVGVIRDVTATIKSKLDNDEYIYDDISRLYDKNTAAVQSTTRKVLDLLDSSTSSTYCYLMLMVILILLILYMLK